MVSFQRPGAQRASAFGVSFDTDRDADAAAPAPPALHAHAALALADQRARLPVRAHRDEILYLVERHATTVIVGETGSGKTTQVPQYLMEAGWAGPPPPRSGSGSRDAYTPPSSAAAAPPAGIIACTQPRRVAAMSVAARVAEEVGCALGQEVGYAIRFEEVCTPGVTKIRFCTDGVLLREMQADPLLTRYAVVMVDEAHERSLATDVLLGLLKKVQRRRPELRVVVSSATLQAEEVAAFFHAAPSRRRRGGGGAAGGGAAVGVPAPTALGGPPSREPALLSVEGRAHAVQLHYAAAPVADYVRAAVEAAVGVHQEGLPGDVLIFLTGQEECERAVGMLEEEDRRLAAAARGRGGGGGGGGGRARLLAAPLHAGLPPAAQLAALQPPPRGARKVVVATNVAETSVTIEGVVYVIDCLFAKQRCFDPYTGLESLLVAPISKASAAQRAGRAGRVRPGHALRLATEADFQALAPEEEVPEMRRADLAPAVLQLKSLGVDNMMTFEWLSPPPAELMVRGLETLHALGALGDDARLTRPLGALLADLPLPPHLGAALLAGAARGCGLEVATVAAALSVHSVWAPRPRREGDALRAAFAAAEGDLVTYLNVHRAWEGSGRSARWAGEHGVSHRALLRVADVRAQLAAHLRRLGVTPGSAFSAPPSSSSSAGAASVDVGEGLLRVRQALAAGLFMNAARLESEEESFGGGAGAGAAEGRGVYRLVRGAARPGPGGGGGKAAAAAEEPRLRIHPSSVLFRCRPPWVCFAAAQQTDSGWYDMQEVLTIDPGWLPELAPHYFTKAR